MSSHREEVRNFITRATFLRVREECEVLRQRVTNQSRVVRQAIDSGGGTHDNAMFDSALEEQKVLAERLRRFERYLVAPIFIDDLVLPAATVSIGKRVHCQDIASKNDHAYVILGIADAELGGVPSVMSYLSPLASQLMGKRVGERVEISVPAGDYVVEVLHIAPFNS